MKLLNTMRTQCAVRRGIRAVACAAVVSAAFGAAAATSTPKGFTDDLDAAMKRAAGNGRKIVAVFSGSDWCGWCMRLEKEVLSKKAFLGVATNTYELVYIDNPMDKNLLSDTGRKNNRRLTKEYGVEGFPTVLVLDASGKTVTTLGYERGGPKKYLAKLEEEIRLAPDLEKYVKPIEAVLNRHDAEMQKEIADAAAEAREKFPAPKGKESKKDRRRRSREMMEYSNSIVLGRIADKYIPLYEKAFAEAHAMAVPAHLEERKASLVGEQEDRFRQFRRARDAYRAEMERKASAGADEEDEEEEDDEEEDAEDERPASRGFDTWLKDWSENIRTNTSIETCASFRDTKLKPFLMAQMDPGGQATEPERKVMEASVQYIWGTGGYGRFGDRRRLVEILGRTAKKPFAAMVKALVDNKNAAGALADWIVDGKFSGEDMRCVFWTMRNNGVFGTSWAKEIAGRLEKESADEWLQLVLRINIEKSAAWSARGGGYANTVTEAGWKGYGDHGEACRAAFRRAWELHKYPEAAYLFAGLGPFDDEVFVGATAVQADFENFFDSYLWYNCYPRWCGSLAKMKAFADRCYETKRHDTMVPYMYAAAILQMVKDSGAQQVEYFREHTNELERIIEVCLPQIKNANTFGDISQEAGVFAAFAYSVKGDWDKAGDTFASFWHGTLPNETWSIVQDLSHWWMIWDGISGRNKKEMRRLQTLFAAGDFAGFLAGAEEMRVRGVKPDRAESQYLAVMGLAARMKTDLPAGKEIAATFPGDKTSWLTYNGRWRMNGEYAFPAGQYKSSGSLEWDVLAPGEFRVEVEIAPDGKRDEWRFEFYEKPADPALADSGDYPYLVLRFSKKSGATAMFGEWNEVKDGGDGEPVPFRHADGNVRLAIVYKDGEVSLFVDGAEKAVLESDACAKFLRRVKEGKFRFNGAGVRLLSMKVMRP